MPDPIKSESWANFLNQVVGKLQQVGDSLKKNGETLKEVNNKLRPELIDELEEKMKRNEQIDSLTRGILERMGYNVEQLEQPKQPEKKD